MSKCLSTFICDCCKQFEQVVKYFLSCHLLSRSVICKKMLEECYLARDLIQYKQNTLFKKFAGGYVMKTLTIILTSAAFLLASCGSTGYTTYSGYDDVYYNPEEAQPVVSESAAVTPEVAMNTKALYQEDTVNYNELSDYERYRLEMEGELSDQGYEPEQNETAYQERYNEDTVVPTVINNNYYYDTDDYYYSSRLRRFSDEFYGWDYYDPYYTNMYFYTGSPWHWGMNIGWGYPSYYRGYYSPYSYYGGYYPYSYWGSPYYSGYYGGYYPGSWGYYDYYSFPGYYGSYGGYYGYYPNYHYHYTASRHPNYVAGGRYGRYYNSSLSNRSTYGYSSGITSRAQSRKGDAGNNDPRYRSRTGNVGTSGNTRTSDAGSKTFVDPKTSQKSGAGSPGVTRTRTGSDATQTTRTGTGTTTRTGNDADRGTNRGNHYGNDRPDNNDRDRGNQDPHNNNGNNGNAHENNGNRGNGNAVKSNSNGQDNRPNRTVTTTRPSNSRNVTNSRSQSRTYRPGYTTPRGNTRSQNARPATRTYSSPSSSSSRKSSSSYTRPSSTSRSNYSRPSSSSNRSSSYSRPSSSSRSSSSYSRPSSSSRSSSSYSRPSSSSRSSSSYSRSSSPSRSSSSYSRSSSGGSSRSSYSGGSSRSSSSSSRSSSRR